MIQQLLKLLVNSNLFISFAALCLVFHTQLQLGYDPTIDNYALLVFFATLLVYNSHRIISIPGNWLYSAYRLSDAIQSLRLWVYVSTGISLLVAGYLFFTLHKTTQFSLLILGSVSFIYAFPFLVYKNTIVRLRDFGLLKPFLVGGVWAAATSIIPAYEYSGEVYPDDWILLVERFLFISAICIPFDIRDLAYDKASIQSNTIPMAVGVRWTKIITIGVLLVYLGVLTYHYLFTEAGFNPIELIPHLLILFYTVFLVIRINRNSSEYYYTFWMDGTLIMLFILSWVLSAY